MDRDELKQKAAGFPDTPGVYLMKDARGVVLYVGKAKSLRDRVGSYFQSNPGDTRPQIAVMMPQVEDVEYIEAESEVDALLMEARLIKDIQPKYNATLKDSKLFPYLEITRGEDFPRVRITRQRDDPRSKYYGPFTDGRGLRQAVHLLQKVFKFCTCTMEIREDDPRLRFNRPCLLYNIGRCSGPCAARISKEDYRRQIDLLQRFLDGKRTRVLKALEQEMMQESTAMHFERAAEVRDQIRALESLAKRGSHDYFPEATAPPIVDRQQGLAELREALGLADAPRTIEGVDISHLHGEDMVASLVTFLDGKPYKPGYRRYHIESVAGVDDFASVAEVVLRRFRRLKEEDLPMPDLLLIDGGKGQLQAAISALREAGMPDQPVASIAKREEIVYTGTPPREIRLRRNSPALHILQHVRDEAHRFAVHYHHILRGRKLKTDF